MNRRSLDGAVYGQHAFILRYFGNEAGDDRLTIFNLDRDLMLSPAPIPLLASPSRRKWQVIFSSEDPRYAGQGAPPLHFDERLKVPGFSATVFASLQIRSDQA
jgi:maltooligosyltrehalose trehalohydrolase